MYYTIIFDCFEQPLKPDFPAIFDHMILDISGSCDLNLKNFKKIKKVKIILLG